MTRPTSVCLRNGSGGLVVEYVRRRRILRLRGWNASGDPASPLEIALGEFCQRLGIDGADLCTPRRYLLFAGLHRAPGGGLADLVGVYDGEAQARQQFDQLRRRLSQGSGWAELSVLDARGRVSRIAWFGRDNDHRPAPLAEPFPERLRGRH